MKAIVWLIGPV